MHFCHENEKTVTGPICSRIVALYHQNSQITNNHKDTYKFYIKVAHFIK